MPTLTATILGVDSDITTSEAASMDELIKSSQSAYLHRSRRASWGFAAVALMLGVAGLYGVIAYSVSQRTYGATRCTNLALLDES